MAFANPLADDLEEILARGESRFVRLKGERIFITGGTGFFGRWLLEALAWADQRLSLGLQVTVLSREPARFAAVTGSLAAAPMLSWHTGDVRYFDFPVGHFPLVIHAATAASEQLNRSQPVTMFDTIVDGTRRVLAFAEQAGAAGILLTSSGAVYGPQPASLERLPESFLGGPDPNDPHSAYAEGKRAAEFLAAGSGLPVKIARGFAFVGPFLPFDAHFAVGNFLRDALAGEPIVIKGDGSPYRSYLYGADLVIWLLAILLDGQPHRPYNVGSDQACSIADLAQRVNQAAGCGDVRVLGSPSGLPPQRYVPSIERARMELGLDAWTPLGRALEKTLTWARKVGAISPVSSTSN